jgi:hypothetical protein
MEESTAAARRKILGEIKDEWRAAAAGWQSRRKTAEAYKCIQLVDYYRNIGAGNETRTRDLNLGKVALYQLSYSRPLFGQGAIVEPNRGESRRRGRKMRLKT